MNTELKGTVLFEKGDMGYETFRIPAIVCTQKGTLVTFCAARKDPSDWADIDIASRRSEDGGETWSEQRILFGADSELPVDNPTPIVDRVTGEIHFLFQTNYARCYHCKSEDDGKSFSEPVDITATFEKFKSEYDWKVLAPGPGHGLQTKSGRLIVPIWMSDGSGKEFGPGKLGHRPSNASVIYSDDHGETWERGEIAAWNSEEIVYPSENVAIELLDGRVMLNIRSESTRFRRLVTTSDDGATNWSKPEFVEDLYEPVCMGSLIRLPGKEGAQVFVNPDSSASNHEGYDNGLHKARLRQNLTAHVSLDDGKTWPIRRVIDPRTAGYSDLAAGPDGSLYCIYEHGGHMARNTLLSVVKLERDWLLQG